MSKKTHSGVRALTSAAMLTAMSVIIGIFCKNFLNFGGGLFRVTFENFPIILSGMMFGPIIGGVVGVATDLISYFLSSQIYPPNLIVTLGAFVIGFVSGLVPKYVVKKTGTPRVVFTALISHFIGSVIIKSFGLYQFYGILVLWRIPLYVVISIVEISLLCLVVKNKNIKNLIDPA